MVTTGVIAAIGFDLAKESLTVPDAAEKSPATVLMTTIGSRKSVPMRVPEGGYTAPVTFAPTQEQFNECTIVDVNDDGKKWTLDGGYFKYPYNTQLAADDWCILPTMNLEAGTYKVTFTYKTRTDQEDFRMCFGTSTDPESMTITVFEKTGYTNTTDVTESRTVEITTGGEWHIGLHAFSPANKFGIYFKDISVVKLDINQPKAPGISVDADGLDCTISLTLPTETIGGAALTATTVSADVYFDGEPVENGSVSGAPGEVKTVYFTATSGSHSFSATATVTEGENTLTSEPNVLDMRITKKQPVPIPMGYTFEPDEDEFSWCTVLNSNDDETTWNFGDSGYPATGAVGTGTFRYSYSWTKQADDWIILPAFDGSEAGAHILTFGVATKYNDEGLEVCMAYEPTIEALSGNVLWKKERFQSPDGFTKEEVIFATEGGRDFYIAFHAISPKNASYLYVQNVTVDTTDGTGPKAGVLSDPTFDGGDGTVTLTFPLLNLDGQEMDASTAVYADITLDGEPYGDPVQGVPGEAKAIGFTDLDLGTHSVTATTYILDGDNQKIGNQKTTIGFKCRISSSFAYQLPLSLDLNAGNYDNFLVINANNDEKTWAGESEYFKLSYTSNSGDDWFITPAIEIDDISQSLEFAITAMSSDYYAEAFEVFIGREQSLEGMTTQLIGRTEVKSSQPRRYETLLNLTETGRYYIGVHGVSDPNRLELKISKLELAKSEIPNDAPGAVTDLSGDGLETGELKAEVSFKFPTLTLGGDPIDPETVLTATVSTSEESKTVEGKPGEQANVTISCPQGKSFVTVVVSSDNGSSLKAQLEVNCGLDRPSNPVITTCKVSEDNMSLLLEWEAITTGATGGHANPDGMDYYLFEWDEEDEDWYQVDVTEGLSLTYEAETSGLTLVTLGLQAYNGLNSGSSMVPVTVMLGNPKSLPMTETFEQGRLHNTPFAVTSSLGSEYAPTWGIVDPSQVITGLTSVEGGYSLYGHTSWNRGDSFLCLPKFSTESLLDAEIEVSVYQHPSSGEITMMAIGYGMEEAVEFGQISIPQTTEGWQKFTFNLPEQFIGRQWVDLRIHVDFHGGSSCVPLIDSYEVRPGGKSGVGNVAVKAEGTVTGLNGAILFTGFDGKEARVFTPAGTQAAASILSDSQTVEVTAGIYVVTVGDQTFKVAVN